MRIEIRMLTFIQAVMEKPDWRHQLRDPKILAKWKEEATAKKEEIEKSLDDDSIYWVSISEYEVAADNS